MNAFLAYYRRALAKYKTGNKPKSFYIEKVMEEFLEETGKSFKYVHCSKILSALPKLDPMMKQSEVEGIDMRMNTTQDKEKVAINQIGSSIPGAHLPHPLGWNQSKAKEAKEHDDQHDMKELIAATKAVAAAITSRASNFDQHVAKNEKADHSKFLMQLSDRYKALGDEAKAAEYLDQLCVASRQMWQRFLRLLPW
jgi:hypothetical protein